MWKTTNYKNKTESVCHKKYSNQFKVTTFLCLFVPSSNWVYSYNFMFTNFTHNLLVKSQPEEGTNKYQNIILIMYAFEVW